MPKSKGGKAPKAKGYRAEKKVADYLGGKRIGTLGKEDVEHNLISVEVKARAKVPEYLKRMVLIKGLYAVVPPQVCPKSVLNPMVQAERNNPDSRHRVPIVWWHEDNNRLADDWVVLHAKGFMKLFVDGHIGQKYFKFSEDFNFFAKKNYMLILKGNTFARLIGVEEQARGLRKGEVITW